MVVFTHKTSRRKNFSMYHHIQMNKAWGVNSFLLGLLALGMTLSSSHAAEVKTRILVVTGQATYDLYESVGNKLTAPSSLPVNAIIRTGANGSVLLSPFPGLIAYMGPDSEVRVTQIAQTADDALPNVRLDLIQGMLVLQQSSSYLGSVEIRSPQGSFSPQSGILAVTYRDLQGTATALGGQSDVRLANGENISLGDGLSMSIQGSGNGTVASLSPLGLLGLSALQIAMAQMNVPFATLEDDSLAGRETLRQFTISQITMRTAILTDFISTPNKPPAPDVSPVGP